MTEIRQAGPDRTVFEANAQRLGAQKDVAGQKNAARTAGAEETSLRQEDGVDLAERGQDAGEHTGAAQDLASQARRLGATRAGMEKGVKPGDPDPGQVGAGEGGEEPAPAPADPAKPPAGGPEKPAAPGAPGAPTPPASGTPAPGTPAGTGVEDAANRAKMASDEANRANQIYMQMAADRQKHFMEMWKIWQDLQSEIFKILQDVAANRAKVSYACAEKWAAILGGYA